MMVLLVVIIRILSWSLQFHMVMDSMETLQIHSLLQGFMDTRLDINFWILPPGVPDF